MTSFQYTLTIRIEKIYERKIMRTLLNRTLKPYANIICINSLVLLIHIPVHHKRNDNINRLW